MKKKKNIGNFFIPCDDGVGTLLQRFNWLDQPQRGGTEIVMRKGTYLARDLSQGKPHPNPFIQTYISIMSLKEWYL